MTVLAESGLNFGNYSHVRAISSSASVLHVTVLKCAVKKGISVAVVTWSGQELTGLVCDREQSGLLLDVREPDADSAGYIFLPWTSIEQVKVQEVAQRRVKFLTG